MDYIALRNAVENSKITIIELCKKLHIDRKTFYNNIENRNLKVETLEKICLILNLPISQFLEKSPDQVSEPGESYGSKNDTDYQKELIQALKELNETKNAAGINYELEILNKKIGYCRRTIENYSIELENSFTDVEHIELTVVKTA